MYTVYEAISPVTDKMKPGERGVIAAYLLYGKDVEEKLNESLEELGRKWNTEKIAEALNDAFVSGLGIWDVVVGRDNNYGRQIDICIHQVLCKVLDKSKPRFKHSYDQWEGIIEREQWIVQTFLERFWDGLSQEEKMAILKGMEKELKEAGIDYENLIKKVMQGQATLTVLRAILGFRFHIFLAQISNFLAKLVFGRGLSLTANAALQKFAARIFGGPIGWLLFFLTLVGTVAGLVNPREWDKYIPSVFLIALYRSNFQ